MVRYALNPRPCTVPAPSWITSVDHKFHVHLVSDSTGETLNAMTNAALAQFENVDVMVHPYALVRAEAQLTRALDHIAILPVTPLEDMAITETEEMTRELRDEANLGGQAQPVCRTGRPGFVGRFCHRQSGRRRRGFARWAACPTIAQG